MKRSLFLILFSFLLVEISMATHNRAGEITFRQLSNYTYEVTITTYTYAPSPADRCSLELFWGDGTSTVVDRTNGPAGSCDHMGVIIGPDLKQSIYKGVHTYSAPATYIVYFEDPNRNAGVVNIPSSVNVPFYVETQLIVNPFLGVNNSPTLLNPPIDEACLNFPFVHNPGAYDIDGDSLAYSLIICKGEYGLDIPGYSYPATSSVFQIDPVTGDLVWDSPQTLGEYNLAILIEEYRNGIRIGYMIRDMQINVVACNNNPPEIDPLPDTCIVAGTNLTFTVSASDIDGNTVTLTGTGGPLMVPNNPAVFWQPLSGIGMVSSQFSWNTNCSHVRKQPWTMYFKAVDNAFPVNLADIESMSIEIIAPAPENPLAFTLSNGIEVRWDKHICSNALGYKIYRKEGFYGYVPAYCETGVPSYTGYTEIFSGTNINDTVYYDNNNGSGLKHGVQYCYMITAYFSDGAESYPSVEVCSSLVRDVPIITNVSVDVTNSTSGQMSLAWSKPTALDSIQTPGPFHYLIYENQNGSSFNLIDSTLSINDTLYTRTGINTADFEYTYRVDLWNITSGNRFFVSFSDIASSIYVNTQSRDNAVELSWNENVPWINPTYVIYRLNKSSTQFDSIGITSSQTYVDSNLINGIEQCYKVKSVGGYTTPGFVDPIINWSQEVCETPIDTEKPCAPQLLISTDCINNFLNWNNPNLSCANDVISYNVYYSSSTNGDFNLISIITDPNLISYVHTNLNSIIGCYAVTAIDSFNNESYFSNIVCMDIDSCPLYRLPNVFTPNNDNFNDYFKPFPYSFVDRVEMKIFNRWGKLVYETSDPEINWDGRDKDTGNPCSDGVYYYACEVYELYLDGPKRRALSGTVSLYR